MRLMETSPSELRLTVHGVEKPEDDIKVELGRILVSKITSLTQSIISTLLARNPMFKLSGSDISFIAPPQKRESPDKSIFIRVSPAISNAKILLSLFSQCQR